jgi:hypothetical protein
MNFSLIWNLLAVVASGVAVYVMPRYDVISIVLAGMAGLIIGLTSRFDLGVASEPANPPPSS